MGKSKSQTKREQVLEEAAPKKALDESGELTEAEEDRSAFNCPTCDGDGIVNNKDRCLSCLGTGKVA